MNIELIVTILIFVLEQAVMLGIMKQKLDQNAEEIKELKQKHEKEVDDIYSRLNNTDKMLADIQALVKEIGAKIENVDEKVDMIINGKINISEA